MLCVKFILWILNVFGFGPCCITIQASENVFSPRYNDSPMLAACTIATQAVNATPLCRAASVVSESLSFDTQSIVRVQLYAASDVAVMKCSSCYQCKLLMDC